MSKRGYGFTLVEMAVAVAILAILMALGMPGFRTFILNTQIRTAAESMQAGLNLARAEALRRNARVSLWVVNDVSATCARSNSGTSWIVSFDDPTGGCNAASSETAAPRLIQSRSGSEGSTGVNVSVLNSANSGASCITFNGFGGVESTCTGGGAPIASATFVSATTPSTTQRLKVEVTSGGAIRTCKPGVTDITAPDRCLT